MSTKSSPMHPQLSFSTLGCPDWTWEEILHYGSTYGFQGVEIRLLKRETDLLSLPEFRPQFWEQRRRECRQAGIRVVGLASSVRFDYADTVTYNKQVEIGRRYLELACGLGAEFVRVFGDTLPAPHTAQYPKIWDQIVRGLHILGDEADGLNLYVLLETHGDFIHSALMTDLMRVLNHPRVGVLWDTHHPWYFAGESLQETWKRIHRWVRHTHWKDSVKEDTHLTKSTEEEQAADHARQLMSGHRDAHYVPFGTGMFPIRECLQLLHNGNYSGWYGLEWEKMWHPSLAPPEQVFPAFVRFIRELFDILS